MFCLDEKAIARWEKTHKARIQGHQCISSDEQSEFIYVLMSLQPEGGDQLYDASFRDEDCV